MSILEAKTWLPTNKTKDIEKKRGKKWRKNCNDSRLGKLDALVKTSEPRKTWRLQSTCYSFTLSKPWMSKSVHKRSESVFFQLVRGRLLLNLLRHYRLWAQWSWDKALLFSSSSPLLPCSLGLRITHQAVANRILSARQKQIDLIRESLLNNDNNDKQL